VRVSVVSPSGHDGKIKNQCRKVGREYKVLMVRKLSSVTYRGANKLLKPHSKDHMISISEYS